MNTYPTHLLRIQSITPCAPTPPPFSPAPSSRVMLVIKRWSKTNWTRNFKVGVWISYSHDSRRDLLKSPLQECIQALLLAKPDLLTKALWDLHPHAIMSMVRHQDSHTPWSSIYIIKSAAWDKTVQSMTMSSHIVWFRVVNKPILWEKFVRNVQLSVSRAVTFAVRVASVLKRHSY